MTLNGGGKARSAVERVMNIVFLICGLASVICVVCMTAYMLTSGTPVFARVGLLNFLLGTIWSPETSAFGVAPMILTSLLATFLAILIALPLGVLTAAFLARLCPGKVSSVLRVFIDLLAGIPSVVYGLLGAILVVPLIFKLQSSLGYATSGCLLSAVAILVIMILPTIISVSETAIRAVPQQYEDASLALGSTKLQSVFKVTVPAARSGIVAGMVLGVGRAIGEAMAVMMVAGNAAVMPEFLGSVRLLTVSIPIEWAYSSGLHRQALYGIGLVLFVFIMAINILLNTALKRDGNNDR
jgi:phosphate transport system permease protein